MAPTKACTSKDLLELEHSDASSAPGAKWKSICKVKEQSIIQEGPLKTMPKDAVVGESSVLHRVQAFLPMLDEANRKLAEAIKEKGPEDFDIEVLRNNEANAYVEMNLALGVADLYSDDAVSAAEKLAGGHAVDSDDGSCSPSSKRKNYAINMPMKRKRPLKIEPIS